MRSFCYFIITLCFFAVVHSLWAQQNEDYKPLKLDEADEIENQRIDGKDVMKARGDVRFSHDTLTATCDQAAFFREMQTAILIGNVVLNDRHRTIYCEKARYYARQKRAVCEGNVIFVDRATTLVADSLVYFTQSEQLTAQGQVVIYDSTEEMTMYGERGFYDAKRRYANATGHPYMIQFDSTHYKGQNIARLSRGIYTQPPRDSVTGKPVRFSPDEQITARGLFVEVYQDSHLVDVRDSVEFLREKLRTTSGKARYHTKKEFLTLQKEPIADYALNRMVGDSMIVQFRKRAIETMYVIGNAMATSSVDTLGTMVNTLQAKQITMHVKDKHLDVMEAQGNAYNVYYLEGREGANRISGPNMSLFFDAKGKLRNFRVDGGAEGTYFPENLKNRIEKP